MLAPEYNFSIYQGADFRPTLVFRDSEGDDINIGGYSLKVDIRRTVKSAAVDTLSTSNGRILTEYGSNRAELIFTVAGTRAIPPGVYLYDLTIEGATAGNDRRKLMFGTVHVLPEVTK